ncbi:MAG: hypothetical protein OEN48_13910 [Betaproteobacteria bacterium]|nr:hypothetical protein [Gammaproteobacteria bacterium]MDH3438072.1 hypothetical protein [Betaproteobacteria bacterium]
MEIVLRDVVCVGVATQLRAVMAFERLGEFMEEFHEFGSGLIGQVDGVVSIYSNDSPR